MTLLLISPEVFTPCDLVHNIQKGRMDIIPRTVGSVHPLVIWFVTSTEEEGEVIACIPRSVHPHVFWFLISRR